MSDQILVVSAAGMTIIATRLAPTSFKLFSQPVLMKVKFTTHHLASLHSAACTLQPSTKRQDALLLQSCVAIKTKTFKRKVDEPHVLISSTMIPLQNS